MLKKNDSTVQLYYSSYIKFPMFFRNSYHAAYGMWKQNVRKCRTMAGSHLLIQAILLETTGNNEKERKLRKIILDFFFLFMPSQLKTNDDAARENWFHVNLFVIPSPPYHRN